MRQESKHDIQSREPKLQVVYSAKKELVAVHLIAPDKIISYACIGAEPGPGRQPNQHAA